MVDIAGNDIFIADGAGGLHIVTLTRSKSIRNERIMRLSLIE